MPHSYIENSLFFVPLRVVPLVFVIVKTLGGRESFKLRKKSSELIRNTIVSLVSRICASLTISNLRPWYISKRQQKCPDVVGDMSSCIWWL